MSKLNKVQKLLLTAVNDKEKRKKLKKEFEKNNFTKPM